MAEKLPNDIMLNIFLRLDIESVFRVRFACKAWRLMIDDGPSFAMMHLASTAKSPGVPLLISRQPKSSHNKTLFHALEDGQKFTLKTSLVGEVVMTGARNFHLCGSCNGLLCVQSGDNVFICNPLLKQDITLPKSTLNSVCQSYGLGYDAKSNTYKVVHVIDENLVRGQHPFREPDSVEVYTLGTNSWRKISEEPKYPLCRKPVFAHGSLHWMTDIDHTDVIQSFDLAKEEFYVTSCPDFKHKYLIDIHGALAIVDISSNMYIEIWVWKKNCSDGTEKWSKEYRIEMKARHMDDNDGVEVMGMWDNGEIVLKSYDGCFTYNPKNDDFRCVYIPGMTADTKFIGFKGSLVTLSPYKFIQ